MIEREEHIGRPRRIGSVAISAPITGPERSVTMEAVHHERRGECHAHGEREDEGEFGGHGLSVVPAETQGPIRRGFSILGGVGCYFPHLSESVVMGPCARAQSRTRQGRHRARPASSTPRSSGRS